MATLQLHNGTLGKGECNGSQAACIFVSVPASTRAAANTSRYIRTPGSEETSAWRCPLCTEGQQVLTAAMGPDQAVGTQRDQCYQQSRGKCCINSCH